MGLFSKLCSKKKKQSKPGPAGDQKNASKNKGKHDPKDKKDVKGQVSGNDPKNPKLGEKKHHKHHHRQKPNNKGGKASPDKRRKTADSSAPRKLPPSKSDLPQSTGASGNQPKVETREVPAVLRVKSPQQKPPPPSKMTFREYLAGVRKQPTSPTPAAAPPPPSPVAPPPATSPLKKQQNEQPITPVPSSVISFPTAAPVPPTAPSPKKSTQSEKEPEGKQSPKSTEKIDESFVSPTVAPTPSANQKGSNDKTDKEKEFEKMRGFLQHVIKTDTSEYESQFDKIRGYVPKSFTRNLFDENPEKCRFADIICMDQTRVILDNCAKDGFVHANWVQMSRDNANDRYIIAQCPTPDTVFDFWHMIWQESVSTVVNIMTESEFTDNVVAAGLVPTPGQCRHVADGYIVTFQKEVQSAHGDYRVVIYGLVHENDYRQLLWIDFRDWPEGKIPKGTSALLEVMSLIKNQRKPILAMSIAGAGRAGTFVSIELAHGFLHHTSGNRKLNVNECVQRVRDGRLHAVQSALQYKFIHLMLAEHVLQVKKIRLGVPSEIMERYEALHKSVFNSINDDHDAAPPNVYMP
uniref:Tyrosine-protein phosphatase domain-containing protein n=1 Tax=Panagrellus redivivus TaxID=6233 RepID=A0A7E4W9X0_PANRE